MLECPHCHKITDIEWNWDIAGQVDDFAAPMAQVLKLKKNVVNPVMFTNATS